MVFLSHNSQCQIGQHMQAMFEEFSLNLKNSCHMRCPLLWQLFMSHTSVCLTCIVISLLCYLCSLSFCENQGHDLAVHMIAVDTGFSESLYWCQSIVCAHDDLNQLVVGKWTLMRLYVQIIKCQIYHKMRPNGQFYTNGLVQNCNKSIAIALELMQSCNRPLI